MITTLVIGIIMLAILMFVGWQLILSSARLSAKLLVNSIIGIITLLVINKLFGGYGFMVPVNIYTVGAAAVFGIPGIIAVVCYFLLL